MNLFSIFKLNIYQTYLSFSLKISDIIIINKVIFEWKTCCQKNTFHNTTQKSDSVSLT
ncbi:hypothetical protein JHK85_035953 [Glycine max]|nr:hypothetical protein JHK85_035953 [Glycine max]